MNSPHDLPWEEGDGAGQHLHERVEDYLDHMGAPLVGIVPYTERAALRAEVAGHLAALIEEYEEVGLEREEAIRAALREHGEPWSLGQAFLDVWARREPVGRLVSRIDTGALRAFAWFGIAALPTLLRVPVYALLMSSGERARVLPSLVLWAVLAPFLAGAVTGATAPVRPERSICSALAVLILASVGAGLQMLPYTEGLYFALFQLLFWLPVGCLSASLAATFSLSYRRHRFLRRRATR